MKSNMKRSTWDIELEDDAEVSKLPLVYRKGLFVKMGGSNDFRTEQVIKK